MQTPKFVLASSSQNRKSFFERLGLDFEVMKPDCAEVLDANVLPEQNIKNFARQKAQSVFPAFASEKKIFVFGFDSMVEFRGEAIGKPKTKKHAFEILQKLVGQNHCIISGIWAQGNFAGKSFEMGGIEKTTVKFKKNISNCQIRKYLEIGDFGDKCGGYSILGAGRFFVDEIEGEFENIIGVPLAQMQKIVEKISGKSMLSLFSFVKKEI